MSELAAYRDPMPGMGAMRVNRYICTADAGIEVLDNNVIVAGYRRFQFFQTDILLSIINRSFIAYSSHKIKLGIFSLRSNHIPGRLSACFSFV